MTTSSRSWPNANILHSERLPDGHCLLLVETSYSVQLVEAVSSSGPYLRTLEVLYVDMRDRGPDSGYRRAVTRLRGALEHAVRTYKPGDDTPPEPPRPSLPPRPVPLVWQRTGWLVERVMHVAMAACAAGMLGLIVLRLVAGRWLESVVGDSAWTATMIGVAAGTAVVLVATVLRPEGWRRLWLALRAWLGSWPRG